MMAETISELTAGSGAGNSAPLVMRLREMEQVCVALPLDGGGREIKAPPSC